MAGRLLHPLRSLCVPTVNPSRAEGPRDGLVFQDWNNASLLQAVSSQRQQGGCNALRDVDAEHCNEPGIVQ